MDTLTGKLTEKRTLQRQANLEEIRNLKCFQEVHQRLIDGWPLTHIVEYIQKVKKELTDLDNKEVTKLVRAYRRTISPGIIAENRNPKFMEGVIKKIDKGVNEIEELDRLYRLQMERIQQGRELELKIKMVNGNLTPEIKLAKDILVERAEVRVKLGLVKSMEQVEVDATELADLVTKYANPAVGAVLADQASKRKVLGMAKKILALSAPAEDIIEVTPVKEEEPEPPKVASFIHE